MELFIRNITKKDYEMHLALFPEFKWSQTQFEEFLEGLPSTHIIRVGEVNGCVLATATLLIEQKLIHNASKAAHVEDVAVHVNYQRKGLGSKMINDMFEIASNHNCYKVCLASSKDNSPFYRKLGFSREDSSFTKYA